MSAWISAKHNMGMALDIRTWERIRNCAEVSVFVFEQLVPTGGFTDLNVH